MQEWISGQHDADFAACTIPGSQIMVAEQCENYSLLFELIFVRKNTGIPSSVIIYSLMQGFAHVLLQNARQQRYIHCFYAESYNSEGSQLIKILGMQTVRKTSTGLMHKTPHYPEKFLSYCETDMPELYDLYNNYYRQVAPV